MESFKTPCGEKLNYPEIIGYYTRKGNPCIFHTQAPKSRKSYIVMPKRKGVEVVAIGTVKEMVLIYEELDLTEHKVSDPNGIFFFKQAESDEEMSEQIKLVLQNKS
jgi:hypothetical protein